MRRCLHGGGEDEPPRTSTGGRAVRASCETRRRTARCGCAGGDRAGSRARAERDLPAGADRAAAGRGAETRRRPHRGTGRPSAARRSSRAASSTACAVRSSASSSKQRLGPERASRRRPAGVEHRRRLSERSPQRACALWPARSARAAGRRLRRRRLVPRHGGSSRGGHDRRLDADEQHWRPDGRRQPARLWRRIVHGQRRQ